MQLPTGTQHWFSTQHCLLVMNEKLGKIRDKKGVFADVLTDLSKAFDYIPHQLPIAKLSVYRFDMKSITFISTYLKNRKPKFIWCPSRYYFGASFISNIYCRSFLFESWIRFCKLCWWHLPYICWQDFNNIIKVLEPNVSKCFNCFWQNGLLAKLSKDLSN